MEILILGTKSCLSLFREKHQGSVNHFKPDNSMANLTEKCASQSGVLPVVGDRVVLVTTRRSLRWIIPKGYVEKGMTPAESAAKEAWEEAGVSGRVGTDVIGRYSYRRPSGLHVVQVYLLEVNDLCEEWQEMHFRQRRIVTPDEAVSMLSNDGLRDLVAGYFARNSI